MKKIKEFLINANKMVDVKQFVNFIMEEYKMTLDDCCEDTNYYLSRESDNLLINITSQHKGNNFSVLFRADYKDNLDRWDMCEFEEAFKTFGGLIDVMKTFEKFKKSNKLVNINGINIRIFENEELERYTYINRILPNDRVEIKKEIYGDDIVFIEKISDLSKYEYIKEILETKNI